MAARIEQWDKSAYDLDEAKEIWSNVAGTIDYMKLGFTAKKPDWKKVDALLKKTGKPAKYYMTMDGLKYTFEVHIGSNKLVMNKFDIGKVRSSKEQREILRKLEDRTKIVTKDDLAKFDKEHAGRGDEGGADSIRIHKEIDKLKSELDWLKQVAKSENFRHTEVTRGLYMNKEFKQWAAKKGASLWVDFVIEVDDGAGWNSKTEALLKAGKKSGLSGSTFSELLAARKAGQKPDFTQARKEVAKLLNSKLLPAYNKQGMADLAAKAKEYQARIKKLERQLDKAKAA